MRYFSIPAFRAIETKTDASGQDRTVLRRADGVVCVPSRSLGGGPRWRVAWGLDDLGAQVESALAGADPAKTHFALVSRAGVLLLVAWSMARGEALGLWHVKGDADGADLFADDGVTITAPATSTWRDKDGQAPWYLSVVGGELWFGNGVDANLRWDGAGLVLLEPSPPSNIYAGARVAIPPCTSFAATSTQSIMACGNAAQPLRIWITDTPKADEPIVRGLRSLDLDFVDLVLVGATRTTGISVWQDYVTIHTDAQPVNLYGVNRDIEGGWKAEQRVSPTNASAPNPNCARDAVGFGPFYFGSDGEVYKDESTRVGPYGKSVQRDLEVVTAESWGDWNRRMRRPLDARYTATLFDRKTSLYWLFAAMESPSSPVCLWCYNAANDTASGPFPYPDAAAATLLRNELARTTAVVVTREGALLFAELSAVDGREAWEVDTYDTALGAEYEETTTPPTSQPGITTVGLTSDRSGFAEVLGSRRMEMPNAWSEFAEGTSLTLARYYRNAHLAVVELSHLDLGNGDILKQFLEVRLKFRPQSRACVGVYAQSERGQRSGRWFGQVYGREDVRVPIRLLGQRIRLRLVMVFFNDDRAELREVTIGYLPVGDR
ncbi:MAG: hypothetical protein D6692_00415 [Planctomycetota bacterium]|nr:MAG: hypothetical protein D6692_00415 [Planctomycetota bacterium]